MPQPLRMTPAERAELMAIARTPRRIGFVLVLAGAALLLLPAWDARWWRLGPVPTRDLGWLLIVAGWTLFGYVIGRRTQANLDRRARTAGD